MSKAKTSKRTAVSITKYGDERWEQRAAVMRRVTRAVLPRIARAVADWGWATYVRRGKRGESLWIQVPAAKGESWRRNDIRVEVFVEDSTWKKSRDAVKIKVRRGYSGYQSKPRFYAVYVPEGTDAATAPDDAFTLSEKLLGFLKECIRDEISSAIWQKHHTRVATYRGDRGKRLWAALRERLQGVADPVCLKKELEVRDITLFPPVPHEEGVTEWARRRRAPVHIDFSPVNAELRKATFLSYTQEALDFLGAVFAAMNIALEEHPADPPSNETPMAEVREALGDDDGEDV